MSAPEQLRADHTAVDRRLGDYLLCERLAAGGLTEVYRAIEQPSGREVAIKMVSTAHPSPPEVSARFRLEAERLGRLRHKHITPLYAFGEADDLLYFVMPLLPGSLRDRLEREGRIPPVEATRLAIQIASALSAAHARGIVHRDIKPENVLIDEDGNALLTDFGIARELAALQLDDVTWTLSSIGLPVGTPEYMPPEQLRGEPADQRVDVYALGAVLYEMLTGQAPHEGATPWAVAAQTLMNEITPPSAYALDIWPELDRLVLSALARHLQERLADMLAFEEGLRDALGVMEEPWESYSGIRLMWVRPTGEQRSSKQEHHGTPEEMARRAGISRSNQDAGMNAPSQLWRAAYHLIARVASYCARSASLSWRMTNPTYQARKDFLRRALQRHSSASIQRSIRAGIWAAWRRKSAPSHVTAGQQISLKRPSKEAWL
jgi:serine/threonine protein kinase